MTKGRWRLHWLKAQRFLASMWWTWGVPLLIGFFAGGIGPKASMSGILNMDDCYGVIVSYSENVTDWYYILALFSYWGGIACFWIWQKQDQKRKDKIFEESLKIGEPEHVE